MQDVLLILGKQSRMANAKMIRVNLDRFHETLDRLRISKRETRSEEYEVDLIRFDGKLIDNVSM